MSREPKPTIPDRGQTASAVLVACRRCRRAAPGTTARATIRRRGRARRATGRKTGGGPARRTSPETRTSRKRRAILSAAGRCRQSSSKARSVHDAAATRRAPSFEFSSTTNVRPSHDVERVSQDRDAAEALRSRRHRADRGTGHGTGEEAPAARGDGADAPLMLRRCGRSGPARDRCLVCPGGGRSGRRSGRRARA